jgi:hypothetical protein
MGGKALNRFGVFTERKPTDEFRQIGYELTSKVFFDDLALFSYVVDCYRTKESHGDLDLLIKVPADRQVNWREYIQEKFTLQAINSNGNVHSFDYKGFQIDFIPIPEAKWETAKTYYSYDPLGNIMGKTFHKFGMSYGWDGLFYKYRNPHGTNSANILLTNDPRKIFEFGGYDYDRYLKGFDTLEEIFKFTIDSKYFDVEMFQMENLKSIDKKRNRKRGSYHLFLNYIKDNGITTKYNFYEYKDMYLMDIQNAFPEAELLLQIALLKKKDAMNDLLRQRFNGDIVMSWLPNLQGKELGNAMGKFKTALGDDYENFVLTCKYDELHDRFMKIYNGTEE